VRIVFSFAPSLTLRSSLRLVRRSPHVAVGWSVSFAVKQVELVSLLTLSKVKQAELEEVHLALLVVINVVEEQSVVCKR
jgi:hypothetical protein